VSELPNADLNNNFVLMAAALLRDFQKLRIVIRQLSCLNHFRQMGLSCMLQAYLTAQHDWVLFLLTVQLGHSCDPSINYATIEKEAKSTL
jgi:hypothetical protein